MPLRKHEQIQLLDIQKEMDSETASTASKSSSTKPSRSLAERKEAIALAFKKETEKDKQLIRKCYEIEMKKLEEKDKEDLRIIGSSK